MTSDRATCWSLTINNPTPDDEESIAMALQKGWRIDGQLERGVEGTDHYQLVLHTPQVRFSAVKKQFPRAHIEVARNPAALHQYVGKAETRVGALVTKQEMYPSQSKFFDLIWDVILADATNPLFKRAANGRFTRSASHVLMDATSVLIRRGYVVENIACNPMTLQSWRWFCLDFLHRKTNRQTDTQRVQLVEDNTDRVSIPTDNANDDARTETPSGILEGLHCQGEGTPRS